MSSETRHSATITLLYVIDIYFVRDIYEKSTVFFRYFLDNGTSKLKRKRKQIHMIEIFLFVYCAYNKRSIDKEKRHSARFYIHYNKKYFNYCNK